VILRIGRLVTCDGDPIDGTALLVRDGKVEAIGEFDAPPDELVLDHSDALVTPGLVDAHTHAAWIGSRAREYALRMAGADYETIAAQGGGIVASMNSVRAASVEELTTVLSARLKRMASMGVTAVEVKSGYGLDEKSEYKQLEAIARAAERKDVPAVVPTFLGLHALPPGQTDRRTYARHCRSWLDAIARDRLARFVDAYVDRSAFSVYDARPVLERARELGLGIRMHAGQFADVGAARLAAELGAASVDHLEHVSAEDAHALRAAGTRAVLLPVASFTLGQSPPPVALLRQAGLDLVVASDSNPGTAPTESLPLAMAMAVRNYGLSVTEALLGATRYAAQSLGLDSGWLRVGGPADLVVWDLPHENDLVQPWGVSRARLVLRAGVPIGP